VCSASLPQVTAKMCREAFGPKLEVVVLTDAAAEAEGLLDA